VNKNILLFRTDRIGDFLMTCPSIKTIKDSFPEHKISIVTSEKNFSYIKTFIYFDKVYQFPKGSIFKKISFYRKVSEVKYDQIYVFDGKDRSIILTCLLHSKNKVSKIVNKKQSILCKIFNIKTILDVFGNDLNTLHQNLLKSAGLEKKISNFNYLVDRKHNDLVNKIPFDSYMQIHLDEKWFSNTYIKNYQNINPSYEEFTNFITSLSEKNNIVISTGISTNNLIDRLELGCVKKLSKNIFFFNIKENVILIKNTSFLDLESILRKTNTLISCHGALTHAAASFNIKIVDIVEESRDALVKRYSLYIKNYYKLYRKSFKYLVQDINELL
tara:strand:+ start:1468 stop:2457 length:990 start_codon:yes stop_codon:yes gene_type:complete